MKTQVTATGTWLSTGSYNGAHFIAAGHSRIDAMAEGMLAIDHIARRHALQIKNLPRQSLEANRGSELMGYFA